MKTNYRIKEVYVGTTIWYDPQVKCKFLWWNYWDTIGGRIFRHMYDAEEKIDKYKEMLENPAKAITYKA